MKAVIPSRSTRTPRVLLMLAVTIGSGICVGGCGERDRLADRERIDRCVNRVCPISGEPLGDWAFAANYRGYLVGVRNLAAVESWHKLPESQQQEMLRDIDTLVLR